MPHPLPQSLIESLKNNTLIPFVGAGISMGIKDNQNNQLFKDWKGSLLNAVQILRDEQKNDEATYIESAIKIRKSSEDYLTTATEIHQHLNSQWNTFLTTTFDKSFDTINEATLKIPKEILKINNLVITTNYDNVLNWACENKNLIEWDKKAIHGQVESLKKTPDKQTIWYLHGKISNSDDIVFTKESYEETYKDNSGAIEVLKYHLLTKSFIFCGFSLDDPYIKMQLEKLKSIFGTNLSKHFMIVKKGQKQDFSFLGDIHFLEVDDYEDSYLNLLQQINDSKTASTTQQTNIPMHIQTTPQTPFFNVPFESKKDDFVGIEGKLEEIHTKLTTSKKLSIGQVAKFEGMGGLGKTQLAVEYAHEYKGFYPNGVIWLTMDQNLDEQLLNFAKQYSLVNQNLDIKEQLHSAKYQFKSFDNMLLIYDNTNGLEDIEQEFLPKSPTNKILITTRNPIQGYTSIELQTLDFENSKKLLEIESGKNIVENEIVFVTELCEKLDGLPLALEMAGAYVKFLNLTWEKYLTLYNNQNIEFLNKSTLPESFTKHENNIANTLTISQKIIDETPQLKEILQLLSYGANEPIDDELIKKLLSCGDTDIIEAISIGIKLKYIKKSSQGYSIHRLLKEVWKTQEQLENIFIDEIAKNLSNYISEIKDEFLNLSKLEIANLFSEQWINYLADNDTKAILIAYRAYLDFYKGNFNNALKIVNQANKIVEKKDSKEYAEILTYLGRLNNELGHNPTAKDFYDKSFEMRKRLYPNQDHPAIASSLNNLGSVLSSFGDGNKALDSYTQSFEMRKRLYPNQDHPNIANSLNNLGIIWKSKDFDTALDFYTQSFEMHKRLYPNQDHPGIANSLNNLGTIWNAKNFNKALDFYIQSFEMCKRLYPNQDHPRIILSMKNLSICLCKNPFSRKKGLDLLNQYKKIVIKDTDLQSITQLIKKYEPNIGRNKSKRKR